MARVWIGLSHRLGPGARVGIGTSVPVASSRRRAARGGPAADVPTAGGAIALAVLCLIVSGVVSGGNGDVMAWAFVVGLAVGLIGVLGYHLQRGKAIAEAREEDDDLDAIRARTAANWAAMQANLARGRVGQDTSVSGLTRSAGSRNAATRRAQPVAPSGLPAPEIAQELRELAELRDQGVLSSQEFDCQKQRLLDR